MGIGWLGLLVSPEAGRGRQGCAVRNKFTKVYDEAGDPFGLKRNEKNWNRTITIRLLSPETIY